MLSISAPETLKGRHDLSSFSSTSPDLDAWLKTRALSNMAEDFSTTYVVVEAGRVIAFYSLSLASVVRAGLPRKKRHGAPKPVGALLLGRLAVDVNFEGRGIGSHLVGHALHVSAYIAQFAAAKAVAVNPKDDRARTLYGRLSFVEVPGASPALMLLPMDVIRGRLLAQGCAFPLSPP
jgi:GNAT superfamily N-acetyltransferase